MATATTNKPSYLPRNRTDSLINSFFGQSSRSNEPITTSKRKLAPLSHEETIRVESISNASGVSSPSIARPKINVKLEPIKLKASHTFASKTHFNTSYTNTFNTFSSDKSNTMLLLPNRAKLPIGKTQQLVASSVPFSEEKLLKEANRIINNKNNVDTAFHRFQTSNLLSNSAYFPTTKSQRPKSNVKNESLRLLKSKLAFLLDDNQSSVSNNAKDQHTIGDLVLDSSSSPSGECKHDEAVIVNSERNHESGVGINEDDDETGESNGNTQRDLKRILSRNGSSMSDRNDKSDSSEKEGNFKRSFVNAKSSSLDDPSEKTSNSQTGSNMKSLESTISRSSMKHSAKLGGGGGGAGNVLSNSLTATKLKKLFVVKNERVRRIFQSKVRIVIASLKIIELAFQNAKNYDKIANRMGVEEENDLLNIMQETFSPPTDSDNMVFNKNYYKAKKETEIVKDMQFALTIPPESRSQDQINQLQNELCKLEAFAEYPINMQEKICRCAFYQKVPLKRVIIRQGQVADNFYFIISGQAVVSVMNVDKASGEVKNRIVAVLKTGSCFGELAFLYNTTRAATVTSLTDMELISIGRSDFFDIFMSNRGEEPEHIKFLRTCPFLKFWPIQVLLENPSKCVFHYYKRGQVVLQNSKNCQYLYVVKSGTVQVLKKLNDSKPRKLLARRVEVASEEYVADVYRAKIDTGIKKTSSVKNVKIPWAFTSTEESPSGSPGVKKKSDNDPVFIEVQLLKPGQTFGLNIFHFDDADIDLPNPELTLISNGAEIVMLDKDTFLRHADTLVKDNIRKLIQPYPEVHDMQEKYQVLTDWKNYKASSSEVKRVSAHRSLSQRRVF